MADPADDPTKDGLMIALATLLTLAPPLVAPLAPGFTSLAAEALVGVVTSPTVLVGAVLWLILVVAWDAVLPVPGPRPPVTRSARTRRGMPGTVREAGAGPRCR